jgi:hypothetical protein
MLPVNEKTEKRYRMVSVLRGIRARGIQVISRVTIHPGDMNTLAGIRA